MTVLRRFEMQCDTCGMHTAECWNWVSNMKDDLLKKGWKIGNTSKCPSCAGIDPDYWETSWHIV